MPAMCQQCHWGPGGGGSFEILPAVLRFFWIFRLQYRPIP